MTDRVKGFWVSLENDIRTDDFEAIEKAVLMIKGVSSITTSIATPDDYMNRDRVRRDMADKIFKLYQELTKPQG